MEDLFIKGRWSLCLKDTTRRAQGWYSPVELSQSRNTAFISYVRAVIDMGISLQLLELIDDLKMSPYMIVMQKQRRFLYMYDEFKVIYSTIILNFVRYWIQRCARNFPLSRERYDLSGGISRKVEKRRAS